MKCSVCKNYYYLGRHECPPEWEVIRAEYHNEDEPNTTFGVDAEAAALGFAESNFGRWDHPDEMEIWVRHPGDTDWEKFRISVEAVPSFSAEPLGFS